MNRRLAISLLRRQREIAASEDVHAIIGVCDRFDPHGGGATDARAAERLSMWLNQYPALYGHLRDSDACPPRHTFFYPIEQYRREEVQALVSLCRRGLGEIEVQLPDGRTTPEDFRRRLAEARRILPEEHGALAHHGITNQRGFAFMRGYCTGDAARSRDRSWRVENESELLREAGCYADFTAYSGAGVARARKINSIYYANDDAKRPRSHDPVKDAGTGPAPERGLMAIPEPLLLNWKRRKWGLFPKLENGGLQDHQPATMERLDLWLRARVQAPGRPDWFFLKLHCQGAGEEGQRALLGPAMVKFHRDLAERARRNPRFHYHYVTAREMYNLVKAAEAGWKGSVDAARNYVLLSNQILLERKTTA